jgi:broad specificity polyphosphatase/5'/3'-nucleotidase SurE
MDEDILGQSLYLQWTNRQTRAINIPTMDEQREQGYQHTSDGRRQTRAINISTIAEDRKGQSIYLRWTKRQTREIDIPTMDEYIDKGNQYKCTYDRRTDRQGQSIYLRWMKT